MSWVRHIVQRLLETKVLQNYSYMTFLQIMSALIGFVLYPLVFHAIGAEQMGTYAFNLAVVLYFQVVIEFGFDFPSLKTISLHPDDKQVQTRVVSVVFWSKLLLFVLMALLAAIIVFWVPMLRKNAGLLAVIYLQNMVNILFPQWFFQGIKQMRFPSIVNFFCRLVQLPLVLLFVHKPEDVIVYAAIVSGTMLLGALCVMAQMLHSGVRICTVSLEQLKSCFKDGFPFFLTDLAGNIKERVVTTLIGVILGMQEVAVYDLATKIIQIPRLFMQSINKALFPEIVGRAHPSVVKRILRYERFIALGLIILVAIISYPLVILMGGEEMIMAYPVSLILSLSIYVWLIVGAYLQFVFISQGHYRWVTYNQVVALVSCLLLCGLGCFIHVNLYMFVIAITLSGFAEVAFCRYMVSRNHLL